MIDAAVNPYAHDIANECSNHECSTCLLYEAWPEGHAAARVHVCQGPPTERVDTGKPAPEYGEE